jgi:hypothetical protein
MVKWNCLSFSYKIRSTEIVIPRDMITYIKGSFMEKRLGNTAVDSSTAS